MPSMSVTELKAILQAEKADALGGMNASKLSRERSDALDYYMGDMQRDMPAPLDRSKAVSTDVLDTVEGLMPNLMDILAGGEEVVRFEPVGPEDEEAAAQETDYVNHVFMQKNRGFMVLYQMIKDALLSKTGVVKIWWSTEAREERETYAGLDDAAYGLVAGDPRIEIVEHTVTDDGMGGQIHDITVATKRDYQCARVEAVPPEEFGISRRAKTIDDAGYIYHETIVSADDLIAEGYDPDEIKKIPAAESLNVAEEGARDTVDEQTAADAGTGGENPPNRPIRVTEHYVRLDYEGDGKAALYRIKTAGEGSNILVLARDGEEEAQRLDFMPFEAITPFPMPHRFFGRSAADLVMDIQRIKTALMRALLDNAYLANNQRIEIAETHAGPNTIDDLLTNRPGGLVRTKQPGGLVPIPNQPIANFIFPLVEYVDSVREWRTGVTRQGQGIDANALQNQSATAVAQLFSAAQMKVKLIARVFAETGIRDLFLKLHATIRKNERKDNTVRLRNKWVTVNPRDWKTREDMTVNVGLGTGSRQQQLAFMMNLLGIQKEVMMAPGLGIVEPKNIYATLKKLIELGGLKSVEPYFDDPQSKPPQPPPPDPKMIEVQGKMQLEQKKAEVQMQADQAKAKSDYELAYIKMQQEAQLKRDQMMAEIALKREQMQIEAELKRESMVVDANVNVATAPVRMGGDVG